MEGSARDAVVSMTRQATRDGQTFVARPGDVLLSEDTAGSGHKWRLSGELIPARRIDDVAQRRPGLETADVLRDRRERGGGVRRCGDVRREVYAGMSPEGVGEGKRFVPKHIEDGGS